MKTCLTEKVILLLLLLLLLRHRHIVTFIAALVLDEKVVDDKVLPLVLRAGCTRVRAIIPIINQHILDKGELINHSLTRQRRRS